jgi:parvulin-like peptidyl-prolyl isomerase
MEKTKPEKPKKVKIRTAILAVAVLASVLALGSAVAVYAAPESAMGRFLRKALPYPAVVINGRETISFRELDENLRSIRRFYESQADKLSESGWRVDFSTPEGQKRLALHEKELLNKMTEDAVIEMLAKERGITITQETVRQEFDRKLKELGDEEGLKEKLDRLYGWGIADFQEKIVRPSMYKEELEKAFAREVDTSSDAKKKIEEARQALRDGKSFEDVAGDYSEWATAQDGGDLGWIAVEDLAPEIVAALKNQTPNRPGEVIESSLGFHIVLLEEKKREQGRDTVRLKQIFARKLTFSDWLSDQMARQSVRVWFRGYGWNPESARIEFTRPEMKAFEEKPPEQFQGDASLIF